MRQLGVLAGGLAAGALAQWGPALTSLAPLRRAVLPVLSGIGGRGLALTYDDGPDPLSTPYFLDLLARHEVRATFFLLGAFVPANLDLVRRMADEGHELAVHGWDHGCLAWKRPGRLGPQLGRAREVVEQVAPVRFYRPPYGVLTGEGLLAARASGLETVLWSAWGRDWSSRATPDSVVRTVRGRLRPGGTVLLHDTDRTSAPDSWRTTLAASEVLLGEWASEELRPLGEHLPHRRHQRRRTRTFGSGVGSAAG